MTLVVPQMADNERWALAPAELFSVISFEFKLFPQYVKTAPDAYQLSEDNFVRGSRGSRFFAFGCLFLYKIEDFSPLI
jgi:hypothetical protein